MKLVEKDVKTVRNVLHMFKKVEENMNMVTRKIAQKEKAAKYSILNGKYS